MHRLTWQKIIIFILIVVVISATTGCQAGGQAAKRAQNFMDELSRLPNRIMQALTNLVGSVKGIGTALADQIRDIVGGIIGR